LQAHARRKLDQVFNYAYRSRCRRRAILDYFGDSTAVTRCVCDVCRGDVRIVPHDVSVSSRSRKRPKSKPPIPDAGPLDPAAELRYERLKKVRLELARAHNQVAFWVAHDSVLRDLARSAPQTLDALARIRGIGEYKLEQFGEALLEAVKGS